MKKKEINKIPISIQFETKYSFDFIKDYLEKNLFNELNVSDFIYNRNK